MDFLTTIKISLFSMWSNKLRTSLTILGIVIGIASVIIVYSAGEGIKGLIFAQIESFGGTDMIEVEIKIPTGKKGTEAETRSAIALVQGAQVTTLTLADIEDAKRIPNIVNGYGGILGQEQTSYGHEMEKAMIFGVSASFAEVDPIEIEFGRFFTDAEDKSQALVAILGSSMKEKLFGGSDALGKYIKIRQTKFNVIGVAEARGAVFGMDFDNMIYVPVRTLQKRIMGVDHLLFAMLKINDIDLADETAEEMRLVIRDNHDIESVPLVYAPGEKVVKSIGEGLTDTSKDDFRVVTMKESMSILDTVTGAVTLLLLAIVAISLVVGGVGIMNIMYVVVTERTAEIGLRKAVGAKFKDIMWQFLLEAVLITSLAGIIGIILGAVISLVVALAARKFGLDWTFSIPPIAIIVALSFSFFFGILFGVYPARRAARLEPIEALRIE